MSREVTHIFRDRHTRKGHEWTSYENSMRDALAYLERGEWKLAIVSIAYASTLPDKERPDELSRRALYREVEAAAEVWKT